MSQRDRMSALYLARPAGLTQIAKAKMVSGLFFGAFSRAVVPAASVVPGCGVSGAGGNRMSKQTATVHLRVSRITPIGIRLPPAPFTPRITPIGIRLPPAPFTPFLPLYPAAPFTPATVAGRAGSGLRLAWGRARRHFRRKGKIQGPECRVIRPAPSAWRPRSVVIRRFQPAPTVSPLT